MPKKLTTPVTTDMKTSGRTPRASYVQTWRCKRQPRATLLPCQSRPLWQTAPRVSRRTNKTTSTPPPHCGPRLSRNLFLSPHHKARQRRQQAPGRCRDETTLTTQAPRRPSGAERRPTHRQPPQLQILPTIAISQSTMRMPGVSSPSIPWRHESSSRLCTTLRGGDFAGKRCEKME